MKDFFLIILPSLILFASIARFTTVVLHELGHTVFALILTRKPVTMYIGSYGDPSKSLYFKIGLLEVWFKYNIFLWNVGCCVHSSLNVPNKFKDFIITLAGPMVSTFLAIFALPYIFDESVNGYLRLFAIIFIGSSYLDLRSNLIPHQEPILLFNGQLV